MNPETKALYQEMILDHYKNPRNKGAIASPTHFANGHNPLCGDKIQVYLTLSGDRIENIRFEGSGCAISTASASMMTQALLGRSLADAERLFGAFHDLVTREVSASDDLGKLAVFEGVREFPMRVKCASLAWHTMKAALDRSTTASTE